MDFKEVKEFDRIEYVGDSFAFGGFYTVMKAESTYMKPEDCPESEQGKLMIAELTSDDVAMFFTLDSLNPSDWKIAHEEE
jgi:hypothetical protein